MTWLKLYQSEIYWLFWSDCTMPCHRLTVPHGQIGGRPIPINMAARSATNAAATSHPVREIPAIRAPLTAAPRQANSAHG
jgi:hypothetical protein